MNLKSVIILAVTAGIMCCAGSASATQWVYAGTQTLCSGETRDDYVDIDSVVKDSNVGTMAYWVRSENKGKNFAYRKMTKYETKLDDFQNTRYLEWHTYDGDNLIIEGLDPEKNWQDIEDSTVMGKIVEIAYDALEKK